MLTGKHMVRDVGCKNCDAKLGWIYEFANEENQRYKEGKVILERALVTETDSFEDSFSSTDTDIWPLTSRCIHRTIISTHTFLSISIRTSSLILFQWSHRWIYAPHVFSVDYTSTNAHTPPQTEWCMCLTSSQYQYSPR